MPYMPHYRGMKKQKGDPVRVRRMTKARYQEIANAWFRRMSGWTLGEVVRQLAHPGPLVGVCDPRLKF